MGSEINFDGAIWNEEMGLIPRVALHIFSTIADMPSYNFKVQCSLIEVYLKTLYDLLHPDKKNVVKNFEKDGKMKMANRKAC